MVIVQKLRAFFTISAVRARPSAGIGVVDVQKQGFLRFPRATLCVDWRGRCAKTEDCERFLRSFYDFSARSSAGIGYTYTHPHAHAHPHPHTHTHTHPHAHARTHTRTHTRARNTDLEQPLHWHPCMSARFAGLWSLFIMISGHPWF